MNDDARLGARSREALDKSAKSGRVLVSAITPWEIAMLVQKGRLTLSSDVAQWIDEALALPAIELAPILPQIAIDSTRLPGEFHADPADRIIVATARFHRIPLVTADQAILEYGELGHVDTISAG